MKDLLRNYKAIFSFLVILFCCYTTSTAQITSLDFKIQILEPDSITGENIWGVYVRPSTGFDASDQVTTASGQVSILLPANSNPALQDSVTNIQSVNGFWNPQVSAIINPNDGAGNSTNTAYFFVGLIDDDGGIPYENGEETLLFTFQTNNGCPDSTGTGTGPRLINNFGPSVDPYISNTDNVNAGMDLSAFNNRTGQLHNWQSNYALYAASCFDCDGDGIANGIEDTDGSGDFTAADSSDLCDPCDPLGISNFSGTIVGVGADEDGNIDINICSSQGQSEIDSAGIILTTTGETSAQSVYTLYLNADSGGTAPYPVVVSNIAPGDTFYVRPTVTTTYELDSIVDALGCDLTNMDSLIGTVTVTVEGPLTWNFDGGSNGNGDRPASYQACTLDTLFFDVDIVNEGDGPIFFQWQVSIDSTGPYTDVVNGTPYSFADTDSLVISNPDGLDGNWYRVLVYSETCDTLISHAASLTVEGPFVINSGPSDATICGLDNVQMTAETANLGSGTITRQWQINYGGNGVWTDLTDDGNFSGANTDILTIQRDLLAADTTLSAFHDTWYRLEISGSDGICTQIYTDSAHLEIEGPLLIEANSFPKDTSSCEGVIACFGVEVINDGGGIVEYQWYTRPNSAASWIALSNDGNFSGVRSDTLCVADPRDYNNYEFEVRIQSGACTEIATSTAPGGGPATLTVSESITFDADPQSEAICGGDEVIFTVDIDSSTDPNITRRWQVSRDSGDTWSDVVANAFFSGVDTDTLRVNTDASITDRPDTLSGFIFRMSVNGTFCEEVISREAVLEVHHFVADSITMSPLDTSVCSGEPIAFEVNVEGYTGDPDVLRYRWQILNPATGQFQNLNPNQLYNGVTTNRLSISDVNGFNGIQFRAVVFTNECDTLANTTDTITLTVDGPYSFGADNASHPQDTAVCDGQPVTFEAELQLDSTSTDPFGNQNIGNSSTFRYEWVFNPIGEYNNPELVSTAPFYTSGGSGADGQILTIDNVDRNLDGYAFWLRIYTEECDNTTTSIQSLPAILNVYGPLTLDSSPVDASNCSDRGAVFGAQFTNQGFGGEQFIDYQWMEINTSGVWRSLTNDGVYNGVNSDTLSIDVLDGLDGFQYALIASINGCTVDTSDLATVEERVPVTVTRDPEDIITCSGAGGYFAVTVDSTGNRDVGLTWQVSSNFGRTWTNVPDAAPYSNLGTDSLVISDVAGQNGYRYRLALSTSSCDTVYSQTARVTAEGPIVFDPVGDQTFCQNVGTTIEATIDFGNTGPGVPSLQWQFSTDGGLSFADIDGSATFANSRDSLVFDAITTNQLFIDKVFEDTILSDNTRDTFINLDGYQFRLAATTEQCGSENIYYFSDTVVINTVSDTIGTCDFDLDGLINDVDPDDDNDGLADTVEVYITNNGDPQDSVSQFNPDTDNDGIDDSEEDADGDTINNGEETDDDTGDGMVDDDDVLTGDPLDPCDPVLGPTCVGVVLDLNVKLQGAMQGSPDDLMRDDLRRGGYIPDNEPYGDIQRQEFGTGEVINVFKHVNTQKPAFVSGDETLPSSLRNDQANADNDIVDWVFVELRSGIKLDSVIVTRSALLQRDGDIRDTIPQSAVVPSRTDADGYAYLRFDSTSAGEYYVSIRHRNHLGVMTSEAAVLSPRLTQIDFTDPRTNTIGTNSQLMAFSSFVQRDSAGNITNTDSLEQYMWAGDFNADGRIIYQGGQNDLDQLFGGVIGAQSNREDGNGQNAGLPVVPNFILDGYHRTDYDLDGQSIYQGPGNDRQWLIISSILRFPDNRKQLANFVILETLP